MEESTNEVSLADALGLDEDFDVLAGRARDRIEAFVQEKPHAALGIAAAVGFVLGGGLTPRRLFKLSVAAGGPLLGRQLRSQAFRMVSEAIAQAGEPSQRGSDAAAGEEAKPKRARRPRVVSES